MPSKLAKFLRNIIDDIAIVLATAVCVLAASYWPTIRAVMVEHRDPVGLDWPSVLVTVLSVVLALAVVAFDSGTGDSAGKAKNFKQRLLKHMLSGLGWLAIMERLLGGGG